MASAVLHIFAIQYCFQCCSAYSRVEVVTSLDFKILNWVKNALGFNSKLRYCTRVHTSINSELLIAWPVRGVVQQDTALGYSLKNQQSTQLRLLLYRSLNCTPCAVSCIQHSRLCHYSVYKGLLKMI